MPNRLGSFITSPLFMTDPVPINRDELDLDETFFVKGDQHDEPSIIQNGDETFLFSPKLLKEALLELRPKFSVPIKRLDKESKDKFEEIVEVLKKVFVDRVAHTKALKVISDHCKDLDPKDLTPTTVGAFFCGCLSVPDNTYPNIPLSCSANCISSVQFAEDTAGIKECQYTVLIYDLIDSQFYSLHDHGTCEALIYIPNEFKAFTPDNITSLKEANIKHVRLLPINNERGTDRDIIDQDINDNGNLRVFSIEELPTTSNTIINSNYNEPIDVNYSNSGAGIVFAIILIILILLLLIVIYQSYNTRMYY